MFSTIKNFFTRVVELTSTLFQEPEIIEKTDNTPINGFLQSEVIHKEPKIKKLKRSKSNLQ